MKNYHRSLFILNIIYIIFAILVCVTSLFNLIKEELGFFFIIIVFIIMILGIIGMIMFYIGKTKTSIILFRIKKILKTIAILFILFIIVMLLFVAQDCSNAFNQNNEVSSIDRIQVAWPFALLGIFYLAYMIIYMVFFKHLENEEVNKSISILVIIADVFNIISLVFYCILMIENILVVVTLILYIVILIVSSVIIFNKYVTNIFDKNSEKEYNK